MRLVIVGSTGRTGLRVVDLAHARGADLLALVRDPVKLGASRAHLPFAAGDALDQAFLARTLRAGDVVISALGGSRDTPDSLSRSMQNLVAAMESAGASRVLAVGGAGILLSESGVPRHALPDYPPQFREIGRQHQASLSACERSSLDWVFLGCPRIVEADATGRLRVMPNHLPPGLGQVTTGDLAELLVREALTPTASRTRLGVNQAED